MTTRLIPVVTFISLLALVIAECSRATGGAGVAGPSTEIKMGKEYVSVDETTKYVFHPDGVDIGLNMTDPNYCLRNSPHHQCWPRSVCSENFSGFYPEQRPAPILGKGND